MEGVSTLGGLDIFFDDSIGRLNTDGRGKLVGNFLGDDRIIAFYKDGSYELTTFEVSNRYQVNDLVLIEKFNPERPISAIYYDGISKNFYVKRFLIETSTINKKFNFISDHKNSYLKIVSTDKQPQIKVALVKGKDTEEVEYDVDMLIDVKGWKAVGNKVSSHTIKDISLMVSAKSVETNMQEELKVGDKIDLKVDPDDDDDQLGLF